MKKIILSKYSELEDRKPTYARVGEIDLVVIRFDDQVSVLYGRCAHRGVLMADGYVEGNNLICGVHYWDYRLDTGVSEYNNEEALHKFQSWVDGNNIYVYEDEIIEWGKAHPQIFDRDAYLGQYADTNPIDSENKVSEIQHLAQHGLSKSGHHGPSGSMGVPRNELPGWDDIQVLTAQLQKLPLFDSDPVETKVTIGPNAQKPLQLDIPLFVSDMSFGALSLEAKTALARGAELAGTGICSGEGGMLPEEKAENSKYFYELASAKFGFSIEKMANVQAFHFKAGQGAKTGTGGHLPGEKVAGKIAQVRQLEPGTPAISPPRFQNLDSPGKFKELADQVREVSGGIPIGFKLSAQHIEKDIDFAIEASADYIILDGRGGGTGSAPLIFRDHISVPTIPALARARLHLNKLNKNDVSLIVTGGLRTAPDFIKALSLGADAVAVSNAAMQAIGCLAMRSCSSNNCPVGIATQKDHLRSRLNIATSSLRLKNYFDATVELMKVLSRACGHSQLSSFSISDLSTYNKDMHHLTGIRWAGVTN